MYQIVKCSPAADEKITVDIERDSVPINVETKEAKYPFRQMQVGHAFPVEIAEVSYSAIHKAASKASKQLAPRRFIVIFHKEHSVYEVARVR